MKPFIVGIAIFLIYLMLIMFQTDSNMFLRAQEDLKFQADELANTGLLFYDPIQFSEGKKVFDIAASNNAISNLIKLNLGLDNGYVPINSYWTDPINYYTYFFDHSGRMRMYHNNVLVSDVPFTFSYLFTEPITGYKKLVTEPTVIVTIDAGSPRFRLTFLNGIGNVVRTSAYEYIN